MAIKHESKAQVIIPPNHPNPPESHEEATAWVLARHYGCTVQFMIPIDDYGRKSPDVLFNGVLWELKSPVGKSRNNIERQLKRALKQSHNIVIDSRRSEIADSILERKIRFEAGFRSTIKKLIFIDSSEKVIEILWKK
jgi:hypothetical protein